ncbi:MAG: HmuY family protein [Treponema sp.]|nr:HmuY family protein [Treponema sp.]
MKTKSMAFSLLAGFTLALLVGCDTDGSRTSTPSEDEETIEVETGKTRYYSLDPFAEVTGADIASAKWDVAFKPGRIIQTNSGSTASALGSSGDGGVWHTEKFDIVETALGDRVTTGGWNTDVVKYVAGQMGAASQQTVNVINHFAWSSGDGNSADTKLTSAQYDSGGAKGFITATPGKMPPDYTVTKRVYIIKGGSGGSNYHRIQITGYSSVSGTDTYILNYLKL